MPNMPNKEAKVELFYKCGIMAKSTHEKSQTIQPVKMPCHLFGDTSLGASVHSNSGRDSSQK